MRHRLIRWLILCLMVTPVFSADQPGFAADRFLTFFYQAPNPERVPDFLADVTVQRLAESKNSRPPLIGFISELIRLYPEKSTEWRRAIPDAALPLQALWDEAAALSQRGGVETVTAHSAANNDMNWGAFSVSGRAVFVQRIIAEIPHADEREDRDLFFAGQTACWSLGSNARLHPKVRELLDTAKASAPPRTRELIDQILTRDPSVYRKEMVDIIREQRRLGKWQSTGAP